MMRLLVCCGLLVLAGLIEGFISPSSLHWGVKLAVGLATGIALHAYWLLDRHGNPCLQALAPQDVESALASGLLDVLHRAHFPGAHDLVLVEQEDRHTGGIDGFISSITFMPHDDFGIIESDISITSDAKGSFMERMFIPVLRRGPVPYRRIRRRFPWRGWSRRRFHAAPASPGRHRSGMSSCRHPR